MRSKGGPEFMLRTRRGIPKDPEKRPPTKGTNTDHIHVSYTRWSPSYGESDSDGDEWQGDAW